MRDWHGYWNEAAQLRESDPLKQVGKTVGGVPVPQAVVRRIANVIAERLGLSPRDHVLELCCGNGVVTVELADHVSQILATDFSEVLIDTARRLFPHPRVAYRCADAMALGQDILGRPFGKIVMQEALQHFTPEQLDLLLAQFAASASRTAPLYFGSVPDAGRLTAFYNTPERHARYVADVAAGTEPIGTWWEGERLAAIAARHGYRTRFFSQHPELHTAHYRFDVICEPR